MSACLSVIGVCVRACCGVCVCVCVCVPYVFVYMCLCVSVVCVCMHLEQSLQARFCT